MVEGNVNKSSDSDPARSSKYSAGLKSHMVDSTPAATGTHKDKCFYTHHLI